MRQTSTLRSAMKLLSRLLLVVIVAAMIAWGASVIHYSPMPGDALRAVLAALFVIASALSFLLFSNRRRTLVCFFGVFDVLIVLFFQSNLQTSAIGNRRCQPRRMPKLTASS